jgi:hypothetical protein
MYAYSGMQYDVSAFCTKVCLKLSIQWKTENTTLSEQFQNLTEKH